MSSVFRAMTISESRGFMKALIDTESDRILGFTMFGASAGEVMTGADDDACRIAVHGAA
jgi:pyruvate/2-oxoglutarate dehydrogenase complex dihydrolipoamide dehydrogenase (E3) component